MQMHCFEPDRARRFLDAWTTRNFVGRVPFDGRFVIRVASVDTPDGRVEVAGVEESEGAATPRGRRSGRDTVSSGAAGRPS
jgi:hypothetical protein